MFFDDDYDYLQHLKEPSGPSELIPAPAVSVLTRTSENEDTPVISVRLFSSVRARGGAGKSGWGGTILKSP